MGGGEVVWPKKLHVREKFIWGKLNGQAREKPQNSGSGGLKGNP